MLDGTWTLENSSLQFTEPGSDTCGGDKKNVVSRHSAKFILSLAKRVGCSVLLRRFGCGVGRGMQDGDIFVLGVYYYTVTLSLCVIYFVAGTASVVHFCSQETQRVC